MKLIDLYDYQLDLYYAICRLLRHNNEILVSGPTGCGKTTITQAVIGMSKFTAYMTHAVVATPQTTIEDGFHPESEGRQINFQAESDDGVVIMPPLVIRQAKGGVVHGGWKKLRDNGAIGSVALGKYLKSTKPIYECVLTTHSTFSIWAENFDHDLTGRVLFVDEGHHAGTTTELGKGIKKWLDRNGKVVYITATAFRTDRKHMFDKAVSVIRTMAEHARDGKYAPRDFILTNHPLSMEAHDIDEVRGDSLPQDTARSVEEIVAKWIADGRPKLIVNVPSGSGKSIEWASQLEAAFLDAGAKGVFNAVGMGKLANARGQMKDRQDVLIELLNAERAVKNYEDSTIDVILACQRFNEGTDWPLCSHVYNIGILASLVMIIQRWGRAMRLKTKIKNYPDQHLNVASMTFFPLRLSKETWDKFSALQKDQTFLLCAFLHNHEVAQELSFEFRPGDIGRQRSGDMLPGQKELMRDVYSAIKGLMGDDMSAEAVVAGGQILAKFTKATGLANPKDVEILDYAEKMGTDDTTLKNLKGWLVVQSIQGMNLEKFENVVGRIAQKLTREGMSNPTPAYFKLIKEELRYIFDPVTNMSKHSHLVKACAGTLGKVSMFTSQDAESVSNELASRLRVKVELAIAEKAFDDYYLDKGFAADDITDSMDASKYCGLPANSVTFGDLTRVIEREGCFKP